MSARSRGAAMPSIFMPTPGTVQAGWVMKHSGCLCPRSPNRLQRRRIAIVPEACLRPTDDTPERRPVECFRFPIRGVTGPAGLGECLAPRWIGGGKQLHDRLNRRCLGAALQQESRYVGVAI